MRISDWSSDVCSSDLAAGARRHDDDLRRQEDRLRNRVGDEDDGLAGALPEAQKLLVEVVAGDLVEGAEGLVHQQQLGLERQRASDGDALLHAAGKLPGKFLLEALEVNQVEVARRPFAAL